MKSTIILFLRAGLATATTFVWLPVLLEGLAYFAPYWPPPSLIGTALGIVVFATLAVIVPALLWALPGVSQARVLTNSAVALVAVPVVLAGTDAGARLEGLGFALVGFTLPGAVGVALAYGAWVGARALWRRRAAR